MLCRLEDDNYHDEKMGIMPLLEIQFMKLQAGDDLSPAFLLLKNCVP